MTFISQPAINEKAELDDSFDHEKGPEEDNESLFYHSTSTSV